MKFFSDMLTKIKNYFQKIRDDLTLSEDEDFITDSKSSMMTKVTPIANVLIYAVIGFVIVFILWAAIFEIDVVVTAAGKVIPSSRVKIIQSLDGGIVSKILVEEGQLVKKDQPVLILDATRYQSDYGRSFHRSLALKASIARLNAEVDFKTTIDYPDDVKKYPELIARENSLFQTRQRAYADQLANLQHYHETAQKELETYRNALKEGIVSKIDFLRSTRTTAEAHERILELKSRHWEDARTDLNKANNDLNIVQEELKGLQDKIKRTTLLSPVSGMVKKINITAQYEVVSPSMNIMEIIPVEDTLLVQVKVKPSDIAFVHKGQEAIVQFTAYDYSIYGHLVGKVEYVSGDAIEEQRAAPGELTSYYLVNIRTAKNYLGSESKKLPIFPGMDVNAKIITGKKTIMHYILKPLVKAKEEALRER